MQHTTEGMLERYPLVFGAAAVAIGAAIAAALPGTLFEDRQMGEASDRLKQAAGEQGEQVLEQAGSVARKVYEAASAETERQGLVPGTDGDERPLAERVGQAARTAVATTREEVERRREEAR